MGRWVRARYQLNLPLDGRATKVTACEEHLRLAREAGREGMVLLKNDKQVLPLSKGSKLALFGKGVFDYVKGGGGSGDVTVSHIHNLYDGFKLHEIKTSIYEPLADYYRSQVNRQYESGSQAGMLIEPEVPADLLAGAKEFTDTAIVVISRFSGEGWDRMSVPYDNQVPSEAWMCELSKKVFPKGDFCLTKEEEAMVQTVKASFDKVIVVLNVGGMVDTSWFAKDDEIQSVLLAWQGGMEGGLSMADLLLGVESPSGKLPDTFAARLEDYPSTETFHVSADYVDYNEDIYVGYRYFESFEQAKKQVVYPFGFGLSYSEFTLEPVNAFEKEGQITVAVRVKNIGAFPAKEVVQLYFGAPQGLLGKPARQLISFAKTKTLQPEESETLFLQFAVEDMASFDDLGKLQKSAMILEKGNYVFYVGNNVRDAREIEFCYEVEENRVTAQLHSYCAPTQLSKRMIGDGSYEELPLGTPNDYRENALGWEDFADPSACLAPQQRAVARQTVFAPPTHIMLEDVAEGKATLEAFMEQLSLEDQIHLLGGQPNTGVANTWGFGNLLEYGVPNIMTADGPAGLRIAPECGIYTTAWPVATQLCATWNRELIEKVGKATAKEVKENNIQVWLAPAVNIHRSPLCGRNFEYYSEDPVLAGRMAASLVKGVQSEKIAAEVKHFCGNNKETNRKDSDSRISERALREIYLKQFEIIVKEAQPHALMTAYNLVNAQRCSENKELLEGILREEWGFKGVVTTDWWTCGEHYKEAKAGNDIKMANGYPERVKKAYEMGAISADEIKACAKRVLELILKLE